MCKILRGIYGRDTRSVQIFNLVLSLWWAIVLIISTRYNTFELPAKVLDLAVELSSFYIVVMVLGLVAFVTCNDERQILKTAALLFGALGQGLLANGYFDEYPPLDLMVCVNVVLSLWLLGAVIYILKCEGLRGYSNVQGNASRSG